MFFSFFLGEDFLGYFAPGWVLGPLLAPIEEYRLCGKELSLKFSECLSTNPGVQAVLGWLAVYVCVVTSITLRNAI